MTKDNNLKSKDNDLKDLYYWMVEHPGVSITFDRNDKPLYILLTMIYKEKKESIYIFERNVHHGLYERTLIEELNYLYHQLGGNVFINSLPLSTKAYNSLCRARIMEYEDFDGLPIKDLMEIRGFGKKTLDQILTALTEMGFMLRNGYFIRKYSSGADISEYADYKLDGSGHRL